MTDWPRALRDPSHPLTLGTTLLTAIGVYFLTIPFGWSTLTPLPWDSSAHFLGALRICEGLLGADAIGVLRELVGRDLYPPGHSVLLGTWMAIFGTTVQSWLLFGLALYVVTIAIARVVSPVAAAVLLSLPMVGGLAPSLMVEPVAIFFLVATFALFHRIERSETMRWRRSVLLGCLISATLLAKYNVGLPLVIALPVAAVATRRRELMIHMGAVAVAAIAILALFLTLQSHGWESVLRFAENRSNSAGMGRVDRLRWYFQVFDEAGTGWLPWTIALLGLCLVGLRGRRASWTAAVAYALASMVALSGHEYLLSRNLVAPAVALALAAGMGAHSLPRASRATVLVLLLGLIASWGTLSVRQHQVSRYYPSESTRLEELSVAVARVVDSPGETMVVGTFNEFSPAWVRLLAERGGGASGISFEPTYPLEDDRSGRSSDWDPAYRDLADEMGHGDVARIVGIEVDSTSVFHGQDYRNWGAWKVNLVRALKDHEVFVASRTSEPAPGVHLTVFERAVMDTVASRILFTGGWGPAEERGRWAQARRAIVRVPSSGRARVLSYEAALSRELSEGQQWSVEVDGVVRARESLEAPTWEFRPFEIRIPASETPTRVEFEFAKVVTHSSGRSLALAVRNLIVHAGTER